MSNTSTLEKAIQKAIDGGWPGRFGRPAEDFMTFVEGADPCFIFDHDFAKALWGEKTLDDKCVCGYTHVTIPHPMRPGETHAQAIINSGWQHHLQQMVIADDPIAYLAANI